MESSYRVAYAAGSRADYGIVRNYLKKLNMNDCINLEILVTGAMLDERYGAAVSIIKKDGFFIGCEFDIELDSSKNVSIIRSMAKCLEKFGRYFEKEKYDLLIILGDRYEMMSVAIAAAMQKICILHLHGGEATYFNYDEFIRHSITKMSRFHFTATDEYKNRVIQLGETPETVYYLGALGAENCQKINISNVPEDIKKIASEKYFCVLFHPETLSDEAVEDQMSELLKSIEVYIDTYLFIFIGSNADTSSDIIRNKVDSFQHHKNMIKYENLHPDAYHFLLKNSMALIGNSSSGIIEAPSLRTPTINIGHRQEGRVRGNSVFDVECEKSKIIKVINRVVFEKANIDFFNPYYKENSLELYYATTLDILKKIEEYKKPKIFFDLNNIF